jgi:hypothetical protein
MGEFFERQGAHRTERLCQSSFTDMTRPGATFAKLVRTGGKWFRIVKVRRDAKLGNDPESPATHGKARHTGRNRLIYRA